MYKYLQRNNKKEVFHYPIIIDTLAAGLFVCTYLARVTFIFFYGGVRNETDVVVYIEVKEWTGLASGLGDNQIVECVVL